MKKKFNWLAAFFAVMVLVLGNGCEQDPNNTAPSVSEGLVYVPGGTVVVALFTELFSNASATYKGVFTEGRTVTLSPFYMAKHPVTKAQYRAIMSDTSLNTAGITADPSYRTIASTIYSIVTGENDDNRPVEDVTWYDAVYFCNLLSKSEGLEEVYTISGITTQTRGSVKYISSATVTMNITKNGYRLPTEAEWEFVARGGTTTSTSASSGTPGYGTHEVGKKTANLLGICDMSGNVWEWCWDWCGTIETNTDPTCVSAGSPRLPLWFVIYNANNASANRVPFFRYGDLGFRVVRNAK